MTVPRTIWNHRRKADTDRLDALVPRIGAVAEHGGNNIALEVYRQFCNAYYDLFNNGGGNWDIRGKGHNLAAKLYGFKVRGVNQLRNGIDRFRDHYDEELEALGDAVIDGALREQFGELPASRERQAEPSE